MALRLTIFIITILAAFAVPLYFEHIVQTFVLYIGFSWVVSTILIRLLVILFFAVALKCLLDLILKNKAITFYKVALISILPGFGVSFISPIYINDYGMISDGMKFNYYEKIQAAGDVNFPKSHFILVFFTLGCEHCDNAAKKLAINQKAGQKIPIYAVFNHHDGDPSGFLSKASAEQFNLINLYNEVLFINAGGLEFPSIFLIDEHGETVHHWIGDNLNYTALDYIQNL